MAKSSAESGTSVNELFSSASRVAACAGVLPNPFSADWTCRHDPELVEVLCDKEEPVTSASERGDSSDRGLVLLVSVPDSFA